LTTLFVYIAQRCHGVMTSITLLEGGKRTTDTKEALNYITLGNSVTIRSMLN